MFRLIISLIGIINKPLLLNLVGCLYYCLSIVCYLLYKAVATVYRNVCKVKQNWPIPVEVGGNLLTPGTYVC